METKEELLTEAELTFEQLSEKWKKRITRKELRINDLKRTKVLYSNRKDVKPKTLAKFDQNIADLQEEIIDDVTSAIAETEIEIENEGNPIERTEKKEIETPPQPEKTNRNIFQIYG